MTKWVTAVTCVVLATILTASADAISFNDPLSHRQFYHDQMRFADAWGRIIGQDRRGKVTVAVLDSGFQTDHPDLNPNLMRGINIVDNSIDIRPVHPHGTATSGILGARSGNGNGISQSALTANVFPIRISNQADGAAHVSDIARGIRFAANNGARVINISYGGVDNRHIARAAKYAYRKGSLVFMAAGNSGFRTNW